MDERAPMPAAPEDVWFVSAGGMLMRKGDTRGFVIPADMIASLRAALTRPSAAGTVALDTEAILQDMEQCGGWREYAAHFRAVLGRFESVVSEEGCPRCKRAYRFQEEMDARLCAVCVTELGIDELCREADMEVARKWREQSDAARSVVVERLRRSAFIPRQIAADLLEALGVEETPK